MPRSPAGQHLQERPFLLKVEEVNISVQAHADGIAVNQVGASLRALGREPRRQPTQLGDDGSVAARHEGEHAPNREPFLDAPREMTCTQVCGDVPVNGCETVVRRALEQHGALYVTQHFGRLVVAPVKVQVPIITFGARQREPVGAREQVNRAQMSSRIQKVVGRTGAPSTAGDAVLVVVLANESAAGHLEGIKTAAGPVVATADRLGQKGECLRVRQQPANPALSRLPNELGGIRDIGSIFENRTNVRV